MLREDSSEASKDAADRLGLGIERDKSQKYITELLKLVLITY